MSAPTAETAPDQAHDGRRPLTADDLFEIPLVSDPRPSPDGSQVAYVVTRLDRESDGYRSAIWLVASDGGAPRQLTGGSARDTHPRWSPDGNEIAFVSSRPGDPPPPREQAEVDPSPSKAEPAENEAKHDRHAGDGKPKNQLWVIRVAGGEARQLTRQPHGASSPAWSPDGRSVAFLSPTAPDEDPGSPPDASPRTVADERLVTRIRYRFDGRGFLDRLNHVWLIPAAGGDAKQLTAGDAEDDDLAWSPDGARIAFVANRSVGRERNALALLYDVPAAGGEVRCLTGGEFRFGNPSYAPDGSKIALVGTGDPVAGGARNANLWTVPSGGGEPTNHTRDWDRSFEDAGMSDVFVGGEVRPAWTTDGTALLMLASDQGATHVHRAELAGGRVTPLTSGPRRVTAFAPCGAGGDLVVAAGDPTHPMELALIPGAAGGALSARQRPLTDHSGPFLAAVALRRAEELRFPSAGDSREIQGWLLTPPGYRPGSGIRHPLIVQIHGGPHAMYGWEMFHELQLMAARGYLVLYTNPRGSAGYGEDFTSCTRGRWGESDLPDILGALDAVLARGDVDPARVGVTGGSYGGYLTNWLIGHTDRFRAAVTQRCVANFHSFYGTSDIGFTFGDYEFGGTPWADAAHLLHHSPISYADQIATPLLIIHNEQDLRCPIEQAEQLFVALKKLDREVAMVRIPGEDHNLSRSGTPSRRLARLHHLIGWFDAHL